MKTKFNCTHDERPEEIVPQLFINGVTHMKRLCGTCEKFLGYAPQEGTIPKMYFGKYKGETLEEIAAKDLGYLRWLLSGDSRKIKIKKRLYDQVREEYLKHV